MTAEEDHVDLDFSSFDYFDNEDEEGYISEVVLIRDEYGTELYRHADFDELNDAYILSKLKNLNDLRIIKKYFEEESKKTLPNNLPDIKIKNIYLRIIKNLNNKIEQQEKDQQEKYKDGDLCIFPF